MPDETTSSDAVIAIGLLEDDAISLDRSALELAALDHPDVDIEDYVGRLEEIAARVAAVGGGEHSARAQAEVLAGVIGDEFGLTGDRQSYDDPDNADLIRVLDRGRGLPVSLSIIYVGAARRQGWTADALNTPGHVLTRLGSDVEPILIDPFASGAVVEPEALAQLLRSMLGNSVIATSEHLAPMENRSVLLRLLMNQASRAEAAGDARRALTLYERMTTVAPSNGHAWWERARLHLITGDVARARSSLSAMLEVTRDPRVRTNICAALDALAQK
ncbi:transglutaminase-like domain-containing protein [Novosphingobium sp. RD2P27]|uniref:Transglutaminase-like domain-containing protein n=1 Tax=Novosphingobium kalidii TaxID=3230299 RepID=A0ABV2D2S3_9SPHN